jgi:hypothetical protein
MARVERVVVDQKCPAIDPAMDTASQTSITARWQR